MWQLIILNSSSNRFLLVQNTSEQTISCCCCFIQEHLLSQERRDSERFQASIDACQLSSREGLREMTVKARKQTFMKAVVFVSDNSVNKALVRVSLENSTNRTAERNSSNFVLHIIEYKSYSSIASSPNLPLLMTPFLPPPPPQ